MKRASFLALLAATTTLVSVGQVHAQALPQSAQLVSGAATVKQTGATETTITQTSQAAILNWQSFSIDKGSTVNVLQPGATSVLLNRVTGKTTSTIAGQLNANGQVFLINPNGIVIGKTGTVQASGFVASTLDMSDSDFLAGRLTFKATGTGATVVNAGAIRIAPGGYAALLGGSVMDTGTIIAPMGKVAIGAGSSATLDLSGDGFLQVALFGATGTGTVLLSAADARDAVRQTVNMDAADAATSVSGQDGHVILSGRIDTSNADGMGGNVKVLGTTLDLAGGVINAGNAQVETSGDTVDFTGIKVSAGNWLVDPTNLAVNSAAAATISSNLATTDVTLQTTASGASGLGVQSSGAGDIIINSAIAWGGSHQLTLNAYHGISIDAPITVTGAGIVNLNYDMAKTSIGNAADPTLLSFGLTASGFTGSLSYTSAAQNGELNINGAAYTLVYSMAQLDAIDGVSAVDGSSVSRYGAGALGNYALANSLDASGVTYSSAPILFMYPDFSGVFEGLGHMVSGLTINDPTVVHEAYSGPPFPGIGLISNAIGTVRDIGVVDGNVSGELNVGSLVGAQSGGEIINTYASGAVRGVEDVGELVGQASSVINSYASGTVTDVSSDDFPASPFINNSNFGGLIGAISGAIVNSHANTTVIDSDGGESAQNFGGLVGEALGSITDSSATGTVNSTGKAPDNFGGLVGVLSFSATIAHSFATGMVSSTGLIPGGDSPESFGGLVGLSTSATISDSYATGEVLSTNSEYAGEFGGLVGYFNRGSINRSYATGAVIGTGATPEDNVTGLFGGLVGWNAFGTITDSYATGSVSGGHDVGGLAGANFFGTITSSYATGMVSGSGSDVGGLVGMSSGNAASPAITINSYYDAETTGQASGAQVDGSIGLTTAQLQSGLPAGFDSATWGTGYKMYPYLKAFGTVNYGSNVYGYTYSSDKTPAPGATVDIYAAGNLLGSVSSGANGYYYFLSQGGAVTSTTPLAGTLQLNGASTISGAAFTDQPILLSGLNITSGAFASLTGATRYSALQTQWQNTFGASSLAQVETTLAGMTQAITTANSSGPFSQDTEPFGAGAGTLSISAGGITIDAPLSFQGAAGLSLFGTSIRFNAGVVIGGTGAVSLQTGYYGSVGSCSDCFIYADDVNWGTGGNLQFLGTPNTGQALSFNGQDYTLLYSAADFAQIAGNPDGDYALARSFDASGTTYSHALAPSFTGLFHGLGNAITGLTIASSDTAVGLFGTISGSHANIDDISLSGGSISGRGNVGALVGDNEGGVITHVLSTAYVSGGDGAGLTGNTGGLVGLNAGLLQFAAAAGTVGSNLAEADTHTGGLVGENNGVISESYAAGTVSGAYAVGGLVGYNTSRSGSAYNANISDSMASGPVDAHSGYAGGLVGVNNHLIQTSYATGLVTSGGLGHGGLVGVEGSSSGTAITGSYYDAQTAGQATGTQVDGSIGLTTAQLQGGLPSGFNVAVWGTGGGLYPYLKSFYPNGAQAITGTAVSLYPTVPLAGANLNFYINGKDIGATTVGANGYYYFLVPAKTVYGTTAVGTTLSLAGTTAIAAIGLIDRQDIEGSVINNRMLELGRTYGWVSDPTWSGTVATMGSTFGAATFASLQTTAPYDFVDLYAIAPIFTVDVPQYVTKAFKITEVNHTGTLIDDAAITVAPGATVMFISDGPLTIDAPISVKGTGLADLRYDYYQVQNGGIVDPSAFSFGNGASVSFLTSSGGVATTSQGGTLKLNDATYTLVYSMAQLDAIDGVSAVSGVSVPAFGPGENGNYALANNFDASGTSYSNALVGDFSGNFDGLGHAISNLTINDMVASYQRGIGLFGSVSGMLRNLSLVSPSLTLSESLHLVGTPYVGGLVGYVYDGGGVYNDSVSGGDVNASGAFQGVVGGAIGRADDATIKNVTTSDTVEAGTTVATGDSAFQTGGLIGAAASTTIADSSATGNVATGTYSVAGGLVGFLYEFGSISRSYASGNVSAGSGSYVGGLVGFSYGTIDRSYATGNVSSAALATLGGLVGASDVDTSAGAPSYISNSYATGNVTEGTGLLVWSDVGGLVGNNLSQIMTSYSTGYVLPGAANSGEGGGGLVGYNAGVVTDSYWNTQTSGQSTSAGGTGLTTGQLQSGTLPTGFDPAIWTTASGHNPKLTAVAGQ